MVTVGSWIESEYIACTYPVRAPRQPASDTTESAAIRFDRVSTAGPLIAQSRRKLSTKAESIRMPASTPAYDLASSTPVSPQLGRSCHGRETREPAPPDLPGRQGHLRRQPVPDRLLGQGPLERRRAAVACRSARRPERLRAPSAGPRHRGPGRGQVAQGPPDRRHVPCRAAPAELRAGPPRRSRVARPPLPASGARRLPAEGVHRRGGPELRLAGGAPAHRLLVLAPAAFLELLVDMGRSPGLAGVDDALRL